MTKKLTKSIEEVKKEKENLIDEKEKMEASFKLIEQKAFEVEENYKKTQAVLHINFLPSTWSQSSHHHAKSCICMLVTSYWCLNIFQLIDKHKDVLDETKSEYNKLKKDLDELRAAEVFLFFQCYILLFPNRRINVVSLCWQVDNDYKLQDIKKALKEWEMKVKGFKKRLDDIEKDLRKQLDQ